MMKKSLFKNNLKSIHKTKRRFISILVMAFLGVGFFSGLVATSPDMLDSLDKYADSSNLYDINIISTLGLTDDDITALQALDGVENAYGIQTKDSISKIDDKESICKVIEYNENINTPVIVAGRNIENENECLIDPAIVRTGEGAERYIGKKIVLENNDLDSDDKPIFTKKEFEIVGIAETPIYISSERGNTNIGNGTVSFYIFTKDIINMDYYTGVYVTAKGAKETITNSDEYLSIINSVTSEIEAIKETRENARYQSLVDEATKKVNDAQKEFDDKQQDVEAELQDAESQIKNAENQIASSERKIQNGEKELNTQIEQANAQFASTKAQIENAEKQLEAAPLEDAVKEAQKAELLKQKQALEASQKEAEAKFEQARTEIANNKAEIRKAKSKLSSSKAEFEDKKQEELAILVLIPMIALATVERKMVDARHIHIVGTAQEFVVSAESLNHLLQHLFPIHLMPQDLSQRYRVRRVTPELHLIDIDADAEDAALDAPGIDRRLYQRTTDFPVVPIHIVRPFQRKPVSIGIQGILDGKGSHLGKQELLTNRHPHRASQHTEQEVLALLALPGMRALSPAGCLEISHGNGECSLIV